MVLMPIVAGAIVAAAAQPPVQPAPVQVPPAVTYHIQQVPTGPTMSGMPAAVTTTPGTTYQIRRWTPDGQVASPIAPIEVTIELKP